MKARLKNCRIAKRQEPKIRHVKHYETTWMPDLYIYHTIIVPRYATSCYFYTIRKGAEMIPIHTADLKFETVRQKSSSRIV